MEQSAARFNISVTGFRSILVAHPYATKCTTDVSSRGKLNSLHAAARFGVPVDDAHLVVPAIISRSSFQFNAANLGIRVNQGSGRCTAKTTDQAVRTPMHTLHESHFFIFHI